MRLSRDLLVHFGLLAAALVLALVFWLRDEAPEARAREMVQVWAGSPDKVERIEWDGAKQQVTLEVQRDSHGRFFVGTAQQQVARVKPRPPEERGDAGAPETVTEREHETTRFIAVGEAEDLLERLAPLRAFRALGQVDAAREEEFGLKDPRGTLRVTIGGETRTLIVGGAAPGDTDYYARQGESGSVYAIPGDVVRSLFGASSRLAERDAHRWEGVEVTRVIVSAQEGKRELVRLDPKSDDWGSATTPGQKDETAGNWMSKLRRVRIGSYVEKPASPVPVVRVEYFDGKREIGFLELVRVAGEKDRSEYLVRSEHTRWFGKIYRTSGEQLEQDLGSVLR